MSEKTRTYTLLFSRIELTWLYRQLVAGRDRADGIIKTYSGNAIDKAKLSAEQEAQLKEAQSHKAELDRLTQAIKDRLDFGDKERLAIVNHKADLEEALELVEEESAKIEIQKQLTHMPEAESYKVQFDRATIKFTLKLIENDLHKFRSQVIPNYEKANPDDFKDDPIHTKSFWVNKAKKSKAILDTLKTKLEKTL